MHSHSSVSCSNSVLAASLHHLITNVIICIFDDMMSLNWTYVDNVTSSTLTPSTPWSLNYSIPEMAVVTAMLAAMIAVTVCGNALVGVALFRYRSLRSVSNMLIGNLAVSDFMLAVVVLPLSTVNECLGRWPLGYVACNVWLTVDVLCCTASIWNLCMIAVDRCTAIVYPLWYRHKRSVRYAVPYISAVWIVSLAVSVPPSLLGWSDVYVVDDDSHFYQCLLYQSPGYVMFSASASFFVPFTLTVLLYIRIFTFLLRRMAATRTTTTTSSITTGRSNRTMKNTQRCRLVAELSTRELPGGSSLSENVEHYDVVVSAGKSSATEHSCQVNSPDTHHLAVPALLTSSPRPSERSSSHQQSGHVLTVSPDLNSDVNRRRSETPLTSYRREIIVSVRMAVIVVVFGGMWIGFFVVYVVRSWCSSCDVPRQLDAFFFWLGYANSSVNPILYTIFNADFRRAFKNILAVCHFPANS